MLKWAEHHFFLGYFGFILQSKVHLNHKSYLAVHVSAMGYLESNLVSDNWDKF